VTPEAVLSLYQRYGSLDQFEQRILDPKLRQASKAAISLFNADELIRDRNKALFKIQENMVELMAGYPVTINSPQIEDIQLPDTYMDAITQKEQAREGAEREKYNLEKQKLTAQQQVQTAEAERDAAMAKADGRAYATLKQAEADAEATRLKGDAEAHAIDKVQEAISANPLLVQYEQAKRWDGVLPISMPPNSSVPFLNVPNGLSPLDPR
jgi:regulator of protease activity HflC (stomatin/prohibitin superfamily)